jgi:hypothetical protein
MNYELKAYGLSETIGKSFSLYLSNFIPFLIFSIFTHIPSILITLLNLFSFNSSSLINYISNIFIASIAMMFSSILIGPISLIVSDKINEKKNGFKDILYNTYYILFPLIGLSFLSGIIFFLGMIVLIIPGYILFLCLCLAPSILSIEKKGIIDSMKRSWEITKGYKGKLFKGYLIISLINIMIVLPITIFLYKDPGKKLLLNSLTYAISIIIQPLISCYFIVMYYNIIIKKEGYNIEHLIDQADREL